MAKGMGVKISQTSELKDVKEELEAETGEELIAFAQLFPNNEVLSHLNSFI